MRSREQRTHFFTEPLHATYVTLRVGAVCWRYQQQRTKHTRCFHWSTGDISAEMIDQCTPPTPLSANSQPAHTTGVESSSSFYDHTGQQQWRQRQQQQRRQRQRQRPRGLRAVTDQACARRAGGVVTGTASTSTIRTHGRE
jgi:hypothetical protein